MSKNKTNPFSVTKAIEFSNDEIYDYWVDFDSKDSVEYILNTSEILPKYILGSRGCGKTHLLRYFSYRTRLKKHDNNVINLLNNDKYIGFYNTFGVLNSGNFNGNFLEHDQWLQIFKIYFEVYLSEILLIDLIDISKNVCDLFQYFEADIIKIFEKRLSLENRNKKFCFDSLPKLLSSFQGYRSDIDKEIMKAAFTRNFNYEQINIEFTPGDFVKNIIFEIGSKIELFEDVKFIFILDEYDKLLEWQKVYINTLVWDKKPPMTYWIGARTYGYKTRETLTKGTTLLSGSDMQEIDLDKFYRKDEKAYKEFSKKLIEKRLNKDYVENLNSNTEFYNTFEQRLEKYDEKKLVSKLNSNSREYAHLVYLRGILKNEIENWEEVLDNLTFNAKKDPLLQKYNFLLFYKKWYQNKNKFDFTKTSQEIKKSLLDYLEKKTGEHVNIVSKFKKDLMSQLALENGIKNYEYVGLNNFIELSNGNVRSLILLLKNTIENSNIRGERPLENGTISIDSQYMAAYKVAEWYYNDAEIFGSKFKIFYKNITRLTDYLKLFRTADNLTETSVLGFSYNKKETPTNFDENINTLVEYSILLKSENTRKMKNGLGIGEPQYSLNPILSPLWNLPTHVRGTPTFSYEIMNIIFNSEVSEDEFYKIYKSRKMKLQAPFNQNQETNLFNYGD